MQQPSGNPLLALPVVSPSAPGRLGVGWQVNDSIDDQGFSSALSQAQPAATPYADAGTPDSLTGNLLPPSGTALPVPTDSRGVDLLAEVADAVAIADGELPTVLVPGQPVHYYPSGERRGVVTLGPSESGLRAAASASAVNPTRNSQGGLPSTGPPALVARIAGLSTTGPIPADGQLDSYDSGRPGEAGNTASGFIRRSAPFAAPADLARGTRLPLEPVDTGAPVRIDGAGPTERQAATAIAALRAGLERDQAPSDQTPRRSQEPDQRVAQRAAISASEFKPELSPPLLRERGPEVVNPWLRTAMPPADARSTRSTVAPAAPAAQGNRRDAASRADVAGMGMPAGVTLETLPADTKPVSGDVPEVRPASMAGALSGASATAVQARAATPPPTVFSIEPPVLDPAWQTAVNERVVWMAGRNVHTAELRLNPAELGPVQVQVSVDDKSVSLSITAAHPLTRDALENAMPRLRDMLSEQGMDLSGATVDDQGRGLLQGESGGEHAETLADEHLGGPDKPDDTVVDGTSPSTSRRSDGTVDLFA